MKNYISEESAMLAARPMTGRDYAALVRFVGGFMAFSALFALIVTLLA